MRFRLGIKQHLDVGQDANAVRAAIGLALDLDGSRACLVTPIETSQIGDRQFGTFFATIDRVLESAGIACVQTILIPDDRWERYRKTPDWIERYVFPGCLIPSLTSLAVAATRSSRLLLHEVDEIGPHYAETLRRWRANVHQRIDEVRVLGYDSTFERTWDFYLAFCEAGFRVRALRDVQLTLTRPLNESVAD